MNCPRCQLPLEPNPVTTMPTSLARGYTMHCGLCALHVRAPRHERDGAASALEGTSVRYINLYTAFHLRGKLGLPPIRPGLAKP